MQRKEPRDTVLWTRVKKRNFAWVENEMERLGFKSKSEYIDTLLDLAQEGQKARQDDRKPRTVPRGN